MIFIPIKPYHMKAIVRYLPILLFIVVVNKVSAQNMRVVNNMFNKQVSNQQMQMRMNMQLQRMAGMGWLNHSEANYDYVYVITMADSSKKQTYSKIYMDTVKHKSYVLFLDRNLPKSDPNKTRKIYVNETLSIERNLAGGGVIEDKWYKGVAKDSCWMFKVIAGPINAYSLLGEEDNRKFAPGTLVGIQKNDGPIIEITADNLLPMVDNNADALQYIKNKDYYNAIKNYNKHVAKTAKK